MSHQNRVSIEIKDIWFLFPYLEQKFTDKEVSTLMIKPSLDLNTWAEPFSRQDSRVRDSSAHLLIWMQTVFGFHSPLPSSQDNLFLPVALPGNAMEMNLS